MESMYRIDYKKLIDLGAEIFIECGMRKNDAYILSESLVRTDMRGIKSHGTVRIPSYVEMIEQGSFVTNTDIEIVKETPVSTVIEGNNALGAIVCSQCCDITREKAKKVGMAVTAVRNSNHFGAAGLWSLKIAQKDMISYVISNSVATVAALNGIGRGIGSNPFSYSIPANKYPNLCLDACCGYMAQGKIFEYQRLKKPFPENSWLGPDGVMTTDSSMYEMGEYIMMPFGNHKGFGLSVIGEALTSMLAGADFYKQPAGERTNTTFGDHHTSHVFIAIDIEAFEDLNAYRGKVDDYIDYLHSLPVHNGEPSVLYPGEIEATLEEESEKLGVNIPVQIFEDMIQVARAKGIDLAKYEIPEIKI